MFRVKDPTSWNSNAANTCNAVMEIINLKWMAFAVSWSSLLFMLMLMLVLLLVLKVEMMGKMNEFYGFHKLFCHTVNINEIKNRLLAKAFVQCPPNSCIWQLSLLALLQLTWLDIHDASLLQEETKLKSSTSPSPPLTLDILQHHRTHSIQVVNNRAPKCW